MRGQDGPLPRRAGASGDVQEITSWINAAKAERLQAEATICSAAAPARLSRQEITTVVEYFADLTAVVRDADPTDKAEIYRGLNLVLTTSPQRRRSAHKHTWLGIPMGLWFVSEEGLEPLAYVTAAGISPWLSV